MTVFSRICNALGHQGAAVLVLLTCAALFCLALYGATLLPPLNRPLRNDVGYPALEEAPFPAAPRKPYQMPGMHSALWAFGMACTGCIAILQASSAVWFLGKQFSQAIARRSRKSNQSVPFQHEKQNHS